MLHWRSDIDPGLPTGASPPTLVSKRFHQNREIFCGRQQPHQLFKVISGSVRIVMLMANGRRQITAFWLPGDMFGLEAESSLNSTAEAIEESEILIMNRPYPGGEPASTPEAVMQLWHQAIIQLHRANDHLLLLGQKNAEERIGSFLLEMHERLSHGAHIDLPMGRQDIADYLGLTVETVSRTLTKLERMKMISMPSSRCIAINDRPSLQELSEGRCEYRQLSPRMSRGIRNIATVRANVTRRLANAHHGQSGL